MKKIDFEYSAVHLVKDGGQQRSEEYSTLNPMQQVPTLVINGQPIAQSVAVLEYLEEAYPDPPLLPKDSLQRAKVREITETICSGIQPLQNLVVLQKIGDEKKNEWGQFWINKGFVALEQLLNKTAGKYFGNAIRFNVDMSNQTVQKISDRNKKQQIFDGKLQLAK
ncbi:GSTZ1 [Mytilus edulis]|uniref:MaiA n=1 Tax=Mytilus edulis TaxID=6550 RepID=A0A8S3T8F0_MYTED|nr:GSTZ1 [Mytilus edulis]